MLKGQEKLQQNKDVRCWSLPVFGTASYCSVSADGLSPSFSGWRTGTSHSARLCRPLVVEIQQ